MQTQEIIDRVEELREQQGAKFVAGWNMAGFMPDSEPQEYDDFDDARDAVVEQMNEDKDGMEDRLAALEDGDTAMYQNLHRRIEEFETLIAEVEGEDEEFSVAFYGKAYWVKDEGMTGLDSEESQELADKEEFLRSLTGYGGDVRWEGEWYPAELIDEMHFTDHAQNLAEETCDADFSKWPFNYIDWERAAEELKSDYSCAELDGETYWYRT